MRVIGRQGAGAALGRCTTVVQPRCYSVKTCGFVLKGRYLVRIGGWVVKMCGGVVGDRLTGCLDAWVGKEWVGE